MSGSDLTAAQRALIDSAETWHMVLAVARQLERSFWGRFVAHEQFLRLAVELLPIYAERYRDKRSVIFTAYARSRVRSGILKHLGSIQVDSQKRKLMIAAYGGYAACRLLLEQYDTAPAGAEQWAKRAAALDAAVAQLPTDYGDILRAHYYHGKSIAIIARSLKKSDNTVVRLRADTLARVRVELEQRGFDMREVPHEAP